MRGGAWGVQIVQTELVGVGGCRLLSAVFDPLFEVRSRRRGDILSPLVHRIDESGELVRVVREQLVADDIVLRRKPAVAIVVRAARCANAVLARKAAWLEAGTLDKCLVRGRRSDHIRKRPIDLGALR